MVMNILITSLIMISIFLCFLPAIVSTGTSPANKISGIEKNDSFYSRQLMTYGRLAQEKISCSCIAVEPNGLIGEEVAKNIVLAGVGTVILTKESSLTNKKRRHSLTQNSSLVNYLMDLNPRVKVNFFFYCFLIFYKLLLSVKFRS
jgi:hypothetical protein